MSNRIDEEEENDILDLDGNALLKPELKSRILKMGVKLDKAEHPKIYYVQLYNTLIRQPDKRLRIKSILDTDTKANPSKSLNKKRKRNEPEKAQVQNAQRKNASQIMMEDGCVATREKTGEDQEENDMKKDEDCRGAFERNLAYNVFTSKIEESLNYYKKKTQEVIGGDIREGSFKIEGGAPFEKVESIKYLPEQNPIGMVQTSNVINPPCESSAKSIKITRIPLSISKHTYTEEEDNFPMEQEQISHKVTEPTNYFNEEEDDYRMEQVQKPQKSAIPVHEGNGNEEEDDQNEQIQYEEDIHIKTIQQPEEETFGYQNQNCPEENPTRMEEYEANQNIEEKCVSSSDDSSDINCLTAQNAKKQKQQELTISSEKAIDPRADGSKLGVHGSSTNIKQILNRIVINSVRSADQQSNPSISRTLSADNFRRQQSTLSKHSTQSITVSIRLPGVSDFTQKEISSSETHSLMKYKNYFFDKIYYILGGSLAVGSAIFLYSTSQFEKVASSLSIMKLISPKTLAIYIMLSSFVILVILIKNIFDNQKFKKLAHEDYQMLKNIINNMKQDPEFVGQFQGRFIKDRAEVHKLSEGKYIKKVFPILKELIEKDNILYETEVIISEQLHHIWKLKNSP